MSAHDIGPNLAALCTIDTIRKWAPKRVKPTLDPLLDDIRAFIVVSLLPDYEPAESADDFAASLDRIFEYLGDEARRYQREDLAEMIDSLRSALQKIERERMDPRRH